MTSALIGNITKEKLEKIKVEIPESLAQELKLYTLYCGGTEDDIGEVVERMIRYVLDRENSGKQGKLFGEWKNSYRQKNE
jgi:hypothetical protein